MTGTLAERLGYAVAVQNSPGSHNVRIDVFDRWHNEQSAVIPLLSVIEDRVPGETVARVADECAFRLFRRLHPNEEGDE